MVDVCYKPTTLCMSAPPREGLYLGDPEATPRPLAVGTARNAKNLILSFQMFPSKYGLQRLAWALASVILARKQL